MNAAVWLGAGVFFTLGIGTAVFSPEMKQIFGEYYPGVVAQILLKRYFTLHMVCGAIALVVFGFELFYLRKRFQRWAFALFMIPFAVGALGGFVLQPRMAPLHLTKYQTRDPELKARVSQQFGRLHALSSTLNLVSLGFLVVYLWRVANPQEQARFVSTQKFRG